jgi:hypothetical protein
MRLNDVFLKDQLEQKYLFKSDNLSEFINNVKEKKNVSINETKKEFKPSAVDITHALNQHQTSETNTKQKSHGR